MKGKLFGALAISWLALGIGVARADDLPAAGPDSVASKSSAKVSDDAKALLAQISQAYAQLKGLDLSGTVRADLQVEGSLPERHMAKFTGSFIAPNRFRHEVKDDVLVGSTGEKLYTYRGDDNAYTIADAPKARAALKELPEPVASLLEQENPSLILALCKSASDELTDGVAELTRLKDTRIEETSCPTLKLAFEDKSIMLLAFDPQTHLMRQARSDWTAPMKQKRADLASVVVTVDYTKVQPDAPADQAMFAWSPPPGAIDADAAAAAHPLTAVAAASLEGKPAPAFKLKDLADKTVSPLADFKGHVVILDFWATWCGPCKMSLPHLDKLYKAEKDKGVVVFALDQQEGKAEVEQFVNKTGLSVPVLLDGEGRVGEQYGVEGIPQTVVIGKDGKIRKIFVGFGPSSPEELQKAVDAAKGG